MKKYQQYLGDGVYASFDGYHINLAVNHHENHVVALDLDVVAALIKYHLMLIKKLSVSHNTQSECDDSEVDIY